MLAVGGPLGLDPARGVGILEDVVERKLRYVLL